MKIDRTIRATNRTLEQRIVASSPGFAPLSGHMLVVVDEKEGGKTLHQAVSPNEKFRRPLLGRGTLHPYQVTLDERLRHRFSHKVAHTDGGHTLTLHFELSYRVLRDSPHLVVMRLDEDPLGSVEKEIMRVLPGPIRLLPWAEIETQPDMTAVATESSSIDDDGEQIANLERVRIHARNFGIDVRTVQVTRELDEADRKSITGKIALDRTVIDRDYKIKAMHDETREEEARISIKYQLETRTNVESARAGTAKILVDYATGTGESVRAITGSAKSMAEIAGQLRQAGEIRELAQNMLPDVNGGSRDRSAAPSSSNGQHLLVAGPRTSFDGPARKIEDVLVRACEVASALRVKDREQRRFLATVLRLQAERIDEAEDGEIKKLCAELEDLHRPHAQDMREDHASFIAELLRGRRPSH